MLYMIVESFRNGDPVPRYLSSWVTSDMTRCYQLMECEDPKLLAQWIDRWSDLADFEVVPVITSAEAVERVAPRLQSFTGTRQPPGSDPLAQAGQEIFRNGTNPTGDPNLPGGKCSTCHRNAGALNTPGGENRNFNTGVEDRPDVADRGLPRDGGFGTAANPGGGFGDGRFNTVSLMEAADSGPFFHNNAVATLEEAIEHYTTDAFNNNPNSPRALSGQIDLTPAQVDAVAAFLRIVNAIENDRSATAYATVALRADTLRHAQRPLALAIHEVGDSLRVLAEQHLQPEAAAKLHRARQVLQVARHIPLRHFRNSFVHFAIRSLEDALADMVESGQPALARTPCTPYRSTRRRTSCR